MRASWRWTGIVGTMLLLAACAPADAAGGREVITVASAGEARQAIVLAPPGRASGPLPVLLLLHGRFGSGAQMLRSSGIGALPGVLVVAPDGAARSWADGRGATPSDRAGRDDVAFLRAVVDAVAARHPVDRARIYAAGMSNGGFMAARTACEASDLVAGVAIVGATMGESVAARCRPARPVPVLIVHGTQDGLSPHEGGQVRDGGGVLGAAATARHWAGRNGCRAALPPRALPHPGPPDGTQAVLHEYGPCAGGARVALIAVQGGGHQWFGRGNRRVLPERMVGPPSNAVDASATILDFFGLGR